MPDPRCGGSTCAVGPIGIALGDRCDNCPGPTAETVRQAAQLAHDARLYGFSVVDSAGRRVDPRTIRPHADPS